MRNFLPSPVMNRRRAWLLVLMLFAAQAATAESPWPRGMGIYRKKITIAYTNITANLTNFPVLVRLGTNNFDFAGAMTNGYDLRFTQGDGLTLLNFERERHASATSNAEYWVSLPLVGSASNTVFYMYYGKPGVANAENKTAVWTNGYVAVWHCAETAGTNVLDSTTNNFNGWAVSTTGVTMDAVGQVDGADDYDGSNGVVSVPSFNITYSPSKVSVEMWLKSLSNDYSQAFISDAGQITNSGFLYISRNTGALGFSYASGTSSPALYFLTYHSVTQTEWIQVGIVADYDADTVTVYRDGALFTGDTNPRSMPSAIPPDSPMLFIGGYSAGAPSMTATIDEVRISTVLRSAAWISASYKNQSDPDDLLVFGATELAPAGTIICYY